MSSSLVLTNCLFCGFAALILFPILKKPNILLYKKGTPIFLIVMLIIGKTLFPCEFPFTSTLASKNILPILKKVENIQFFNVKLGSILFYIWFSIAIALLIYVFFKHRKLMNTLSIVPEIKNISLLQIIMDYCKQEKFRKRPRVIQLDIRTGPFIVGIKKPIIVLPLNLSKSEIEFILMHEFEHFKNHHIIIKQCIEILKIIYWWNPLIWLLHKKVICALEIHADTNVMQALSNNKARLSYLHTLLNISKKTERTNLGLSFILKNNMIEYRLYTALKYGFSQKNNKTTLSDFFPLIISICFLFFSFIYTFESYDISPTKVKDTFTIDKKTDYFKLREDMFYDLYINGKYVITMPHVPNDLSQLSVYK